MSIFIAYVVSPLIIVLCGISEERFKPWQANLIYGVALFLFCYHAPELEF